MRSKFALNDLIVVTEPIEITPCDTTIEKGDRGKIIDIDPEIGDLTIRLCGHHPDLYCQNNCIALAARDAGKIKLANPRPFTFKKAFGLISATAMICTTLTIIMDERGDAAIVAMLHSETIAEAFAAPVGCTNSNGDKFSPTTLVKDLLTTTAAN